MSAEAPGIYFTFLRAAGPDAFTFVRGKRVSHGSLSPCLLPSGQLIPFVTTVEERACHHATKEKGKVGAVYKYLFFFFGCAIFCCLCVSACACALARAPDRKSRGARHLLRRALIHVCGLCTSLHSGRPRIMSGAGNCKLTDSYISCSLCIIYIIVGHLESFPHCLAF